MAFPEDVHQFRNTDRPKIRLELLPVQLVFREVQFGSGGMDSFCEECVKLRLEHSLESIGIDLGFYTGSLFSNPMDCVMRDQAIDQRVIRVAFLI